MPPLQHPHQTLSETITIQNSKNYHVILITWFSSPQSKVDGISCAITRYWIIISHCFNLQVRDKENAQGIVFFICQYDIPISLNFSQQKKDLQNTEALTDSPGIQILHFFPFKTSSSTVPQNLHEKHIFSQQQVKVPIEQIEEVDIKYPTTTRGRAKTRNKECFIWINY